MKVVARKCEAASQGYQMTDSTQRTIRAFIAIELPSQVHALLTTVQAELQETMEGAARAVRWVRPESTHLTLQFLGDVPSHLVAQIERGLRDACRNATPFTLHVSELGAFPNPRRPRVVWVGLTGDGHSIAALQALHAAVTARMQPLGFQPDKSFKPHLTLGRIRENAARGDLAGIAETLQYPEAQPSFSAALHVSGVSLMRSELDRGGAIYTRLAHVQFEQMA
jgi:RNA 2',3'-cyclic 3'-phosphodiesterase